VNKLKEGLEPVPGKMSALPIDDRGYPVPWFVTKLPSGEFEFRAFDPDKLRLAVAEHRCWICGEKLGKHMVFVIGPVSALNGTHLEPPSHRECALYALRNCPFLNNPSAERRPAGVGRGADILYGQGLLIKKNPGVCLAWTVHSYGEIINPVSRKVVSFNIGKPDKIEWFKEGRAATREEVEEAMRVAIEAFMDECGTSPEIIKKLEGKALALEPWVPNEGIVTA